jgi:hypothetical protein
MSTSHSSIFRDCQTKEKQPPLALSTAADLAAPVEEVAARDGGHSRQATSAQSPRRFDTATSPPDPPCPLVGGVLPRGLVSDLRPLEVERIICDLPRRPADNLPGRSETWFSTSADDSQAHGGECSSFCIVLIYLSSGRHLAERAQTLQDARKPMHTDPCTI